MWFILFRLFFAVCSGQNQDFPTGMCQDNPFVECKPPSATDDDVLALNQERFQELCPTVKQYFQCLKIREENCDVLLFDPPLEYHKIMGILNDICDNSTSLHQGFVESIPCYKEVKNNFKQVCFDSKPDVIWTYEDFRLHGSAHEYLLQETCKTSGTEYLNYAKLSCLNYLYVVNCVADYSATQCSSRGRNATIELARRVHYTALGCNTGTIPLLQQVIPNLDLTEPLKHSLLRNIDELYD